MNESKATRYQRLRRRADAWALALSAAMLALIAVTPIGGWLYRECLALVAGAPELLQDALALVLFVAVGVLLCEAVALPAVLYRARQIDSVYGRGSSDGKAWLTGAIVGVVAAIGAAAIIRIAIAAAGSAWWLVAGVLLSATLVLAVRSGPAILARLASVKPLDRPVLAARIADLSKRAGVPVVSIHEWGVDESSTTIAMVAGVGAGRRVLLARDVAREWSDDEVTVVVAHELAHHVYHDLLRALALNAVVLCSGLWAADVVVKTIGVWVGIGGGSDPAAVPLIALVAGAVWLAATPLRHAQSRRQERRADRFALAWTGYADAFAAAVRRAGARHLAEERPSLLTRWFYHRHPSVTERLALAEAYRRDGRAI